LGVDLARLKGTGKHGQISAEDVQAAAAAAPAVPAAPVASLPGEAGQDAWGPVRSERMTRIRRTIAEQMTRSTATVARVTNFDDADVTELDDLRHGVPADHLGPSVKLTMMPFVMKAVATLLRRHPSLNASIDAEHDQVVYKEYVNLGVAVDTPRGLVVPVVRNADRMDVLDLARALALLAERARSSQFAVEDLRGGTFTISNLGAVGGTYSTPIVNYPEVAVLVLGRARWMPAVRGKSHDRIEPRLMMPLSLSYDHRLVDGAAAGRFLNDVRAHLEAPAMLLL
jgi:pyruvate dehydrogenase E2 component (dihydrolipoamide acetyltransferase)